MYLSNLDKEDIGIVIGYKDETIPLRLLELGILPGIKVKIVHVSIFSDPLCIEYDRSIVLLRKKEAKNILVEKILT